MTRSRSREHVKGTTVELVNDAQLKELAREPVRELFTAARRDSVMRPLVVLLAFLPGLLVFWNPSLDEVMSKQGLRALEIGTGDTPWDWITTASRESSSHPGPAKPLATLLMALGLKLTLFTPMSRLLLASYLSSVFLLLCLGGLAKQLGGSRLAVLVVLVACSHREILALSGALPPVALPLAFSVLSFRGLLAHQSAGGPWASWPLLGGGIALAACWLSGGELAIGTWCVLCAQSVIGCFAVERSGSWSRWLGRWLSRWASSLWGLLFVTTIGLAAVLGWQLAFTEKVDLGDSVQRWPALFGRWSVDSRGTLAAQFLLNVCGAWLGFVLLGAIQIACGRERPRDQHRVDGRWFLIGWLSVAGTCWWQTWSVHGGEFTTSVGWPAFFLLPLLFLAAWGLEAVFLREFGFASVLSAVLVTAGVLLIPYWPSQMPSSVSGQAVTLGILLSVGSVLIGIWFIRRIAETEFRRRLTLVACVMMMLVVDVLDGLRSVPPLLDDERELRAFRRQLQQDTPPSACWLVTEVPAPARLRFFLRSLWPDVEVREARSEGMVSANPWEAAATAAAQRAGPTDSKSTFAIVVTWGSPRLPSEEWRRRGQVLTQSAAPHFLQGRPLKAYRWTQRSSRPQTR